MPIEMLTRPEQQASPPLAEPLEDHGLRAATQRQAERVRRLKIHAAAYGLGALVVTTLWIVHEWDANGAFARFGHDGNQGDWNPTLWALVVLVWGLVVGIRALRVYFERPVAAAEVEREARRFALEPGVERARGDAGLRRLARARIERLGRLRFHVAAWLLGMIMLTPLNALIEWQDNGGFERFSGNSEPGSWEPWIGAVGGIWALALALLVARTVYLNRRERIQARSTN